MQTINAIHAAAAALFTAHRAAIAPQGFTADGSNAAAAADAAAQPEALAAFNIARAAALQAAVAAAADVADAIARADQSKAAASAEGKAAQSTLWECILAIAAAAHGNVTDFDAHAKAFHAAALPAVQAAARMQAKAEPKGWKTFQNRASDVRILMRAGYDVLLPLPVDLLYEDAASDKAREYVNGMSEHGPATQRQVQAAVATLRQREASAADAAYKALYPVSVSNPADWQPANLKELQVQHFAMSASVATLDKELTAARAALHSALQGDAREAFKLREDELLGRIAERDEAARLQAAVLARQDAELAELRAIKAAALQAFGEDADILETLRATAAA